MEVTGSVRDGDGAGSLLPPDVTGALTALVPHAALGDALARGGRVGWSLTWRQTRVEESEAAELLGAPVPTLPALRGPDVVEVLCVHRGLPTEPLRTQVEAGLVLLHLRIAYLPATQRWEHAQRWPILRGGGSVLEVRAQYPDPARRGPWPQRVAGHRDMGSDDFAVVTVAGTDVGVQVDTSGVVHLTWVAVRGGRVLQMSLLTRRDARAAVELVLRGGLLA